MNVFAKFALILLLIAALSFVLWQKGRLTISAKRAVAFIGHRGVGFWGASVTACTGYTKRSMRLEPGREYIFTLDYLLDNGSITVELTCDKQPVAVFDRANTTATVTGQAGLYVITTHFQSASGVYELKWSTNEI